MGEACAIIAEMEAGQLRYAYLNSVYRGRGVHMCVVGLSCFLLYVQNQPGQVIEPSSRSS